MNILLPVAVSLFFVLTGCATTPPPPYHTECDQAGRYARSIETLKQIGVRRADISSYTAVPSAVTFPMQRVQSLVYLKQFNTPAEAYGYFYTQCIDTGYVGWLHTLEAEEKKEIMSLLPPAAPKMDTTLPPTPTKVKPSVQKKKVIRRKK